MQTRGPLHQDHMSPQNNLGCLKQQILKVRNILEGIMCVSRVFTNGSFILVPKRMHSMFYTHKMTYMTNSHQSHTCKSCRKYKSENGAITDLWIYQRWDQVSWRVNIPCRTVTPTVSPISTLSSITRTISFLLVYIRFEAGRWIFTRRKIVDCDNAKHLRQT
jgi:hypothetical protein